MEPTERNLRAYEAAHRRRRDTPRSALPEIVREWLPDLRGRHVLHLGCGRGEATAELVTLGALVTGLDASDEALVAARERVPAAAFVHAETHAPPPELLRGRFHLVYADEGSLVSGDVGAAARAVLAALRDGGFLLLYDVHPVRAHVDPLFHWRGSYFGGGRGEATAPLGDVVTAIAQAGLVVRRLAELPAPGEGPHVPGRFALVARKPS
jgi:SAM-dependent methyltransferase